MGAGANENRTKTNRNQIESDSGNFRSIAVPSYSGKLARRGHRRVSPGPECILVRASPGYLGRVHRLVREPRSRVHTETFLYAGLPQTVKPVENPTKPIEKRTQTSDNDRNARNLGRPREILSQSLHHKLPQQARNFPNGAPELLDKSAWHLVTAIE